MVIDKEYLQVLRKRKKDTRVYQKHQMTGLMLAEILHDNAHKALYIKLAKSHGEGRLLGLAKTVAENTRVKNKGAYFMCILFSKDDGQNLDY